MRVVTNFSELWSTFKQFVRPSLCTPQVLLGEVSAGLSTTQVVVKELKASASVQDQMQFLDEVQPYRSETTQHTDTNEAVEQHKK